MQVEAQAGTFGATRPSPEDVAKRVYQIVSIPVADVQLQNFAMLLRIGSQEFERPESVSVRIVVVTITFTRGSTSTVVPGTVVSWHFPDPVNELVNQDRQIVVLELPERRVVLGQLPEPARFATAAELDRLDLQQCLRAVQRALTNCGRTG